MDPEFSAEAVAREFSLDPVLTAQVLKVAKSALFAREQPVHSVAEVVVLLGATRLQALVLSGQAFSFLDEDVCPGSSPQGEWRHAMAVASEAEILARRAGAEPRLVEMAFTTGILHDLGKVLLAANLPDRYSAVLHECHGRDLPLSPTERDRLGVSHGELGACLLGVWGLSLPVLEGVAWHDEPGSALGQGIRPVALVHVANCRVRQRPPDAQALRLIGAGQLLE